MTAEKKELAAPKTATMMADSLTVDEVIAHVKVIREAVSKVMEKGENKDYGIIPGTKKPTLFKSGAEKLCVLFRLAPSFETTEYWDDKHLTVKSKCTLIHINSGKVMGSGDAICSTKEKKYAKRKDGNKVVDNNELPDLYNTIIKMADKRALIAAVLVVTAASSEFTQDRGDDEEPASNPDEADKKPAKEIEGKAEVKAPVKGEVQKWTGKIGRADPETDGRNKYLHIVGADGIHLLLVQPPEGDKARMDIYRMLCLDIASALSAKVDVEFSYSVSGKNNNLVCGFKPLGEPVTEVVRE